MKSKSFIITLTLVFMATFSIANEWPILKTSIEKAFDSYHNKNYASAKIGFENSEHVFPALSAYGLSMCFANDSTGKIDLDSAYLMVKKAIALWENASKRESNVAKRLSISIADFYSFQDTVIQKAFNKALSSGTQQALDSFILVFPVKEFVDSAVSVRNRIAFEDAEKDGTAASYLAYMNRFPESSYFSISKNRYYRLLYDESVKGGSIGEYEVFIRSFPGNPYVHDAWRKLFSLSTRNSSEEKPYLDFLGNYPSTPLIEDVWFIIRENYFLRNPIKSKDDFIRQFPQCPVDFENVSELELRNGALLPFSLGGNWGFLDSIGSIVVKPNYSIVHAFNGGLARVVDHSKTGFVNVKGEEVVKPYFDSATDFIQGFSVVSESGRYGIIDRRGNTVVPVSNDSLSIAGENTFIQYRSGRCNYLNRMGEQLSDSVFVSCGEMLNGASVCYNGMGYGLIRNDGRLVLQCDFRDVIRLSDSRFSISKGDKFALADTGGNILTQFIFDAIGEFSSGLAAASIGGKFGYIDQRGRTKIPFIYQVLDGFPASAKFNGGYAVISLSGAFGIGDTSGNVVIADSFNRVDLLENGFAIVYDSTYGALLEIENDRFLTESIFDTAGVFSFGSLPVRVGDLWGAIDKSGNYLVEPRYFSITPLPNGYHIVAAENGYGIKDNKSGGVLVAEYDAADFMFGRYVKLIQAGNIHWFDTNTGSLITTQNNEFIQQDK
ncbi:MAG: WG repeat-containing protein [Bacteroidota bacterium]